MKNIIVGISFDKHTDRLLEQAGLFARQFNAKVWLIHIAAPNPAFVGYEPGPQVIRNDRAGDLRNEHKELQVLATRLNQEGINTEALLVQGPTVETFLEEANKLQADLIIVGCQEHSFLHNLFIENTSMELFKKTNIPLLAVPTI
jgi:nucleotide-binding universal stress UspA family protein